MTALYPNYCQYCTLNLPISDAIEISSGEEEEDSDVVLVTSEPQSLINMNTVPLLFLFQMLLRLALVRRRRRTVNLSW